MLTSSKKAHFKKLLEQSLDAFAKEGDHRSSSEFFRSENADPIDRASAESNESLDFRFRERNSNLIRKIQDALERLEDGTFGICDECGMEISEKRLQVRPIAKLCIGCKEKEENYEKLFGT
jgi:DnaK suppressor protein